MRVVMCAAAALIVSACGRGDTHLVAPEAPKPNVAMAETFQSCEWGEVTGAGLSIWSFACGPDRGNFRLVADETLPGFVIEQAGEAGPIRATAIQVFKREHDAAIESILPAIRALSPGPASETCAFAPAPGRDGSGKARFVFAPTGAAKDAWDKAMAGAGEIPPPPCGPLGEAVTGQLTFELLGHDKVVMIQQGSEIQIFDTTTLKESGDGAHAAPAGEH